MAATMTIFHLVKSRKDDMLDIDIKDGQPALSINGTIIGTESEIIVHLNKSELYDELKQELFLKRGDTNE